MIFKNLNSQTDIKIDSTNKKMVRLFSSTAHLKKPISGWVYTTGSSFSESPSITGSVAFVSSSFYVSYASDLTSSNYSQLLPWNSLMSTIGSRFNKTDGLYEYYVNGTRVREAIIVSLNPDNFKEGIDYDNFFIVLSGSIGNNSFDQTNSNFNTASALVLAPYFVKESVDDTSALENNKFNSLAPAIELRSANNSAFLSYDASLESVNINWDTYTPSNPYGFFFPDIGIILIFPELFQSNYSQLVSSIRSSGNRTLNSLNSIMWVGGYGYEKNEKRIYFVRLNHDEFNHTINPTAERLVGGREVKLESLISNPRTFVTKIGLYNDQNELLAIASLSQPEYKDQLEVMTFKIQIDT